jgi:hypothetical protein
MFQTRPWYRPGAPVAIQPVEPKLVLSRLLVYWLPVARRLGGPNGIERDQSQDDV